MKTSTWEGLGVAPDYRVNIWNYGGETVSVRLVTLATWAHALTMEVEGIQPASVSVGDIVREFLGAPGPEEYPLEWIAEHIVQSYKSILEQLQ